MKTKYCHRCKKRKPLSKFGKNKHRSGGYNTYCGPCKKLYDAEYQKKNKIRVNAIRAKNKKKLRNEARKILDKKKQVPCADCKKEYIPFAMDFDHVRGKKEFNISSITNKTTSIKRIEKELAKCDVVCAICHRYRTYNRKKQHG